MEMVVKVEVVVNRGGEVVKVVWTEEVVVKVNRGSGDGGGGDGGGDGQWR